jgi:hypothetical protein
MSAAHKTSAAPLRRSARLAANKEHSVKPQPSSRKSVKKVAKKTQALTRTKINVRLPSSHYAQTKLKAPTRCFDFYEYSDVAVAGHLNEDEDNFVVIQDDIDAQEVFCSTRSHLLKALKPSNLFFECQGENFIVPAVSANPYVVLGLRDAIVVDATSLQAAMKQAAGKKAKSRVIVVTKSHYVPWLVSQGVLSHKPGSSVSGKHCQPSSGAMVYVANAL